MPHTSGPILSNLPLLYRGKTRETYPTKTGSRLLVVASDRLSTHNVVHRSLVPMKGEVLTALTIYWLNELLEKAGIRHHLIAWGEDIYHFLEGDRRDYPDDLHHRAIVVRRLDIIPKEMIWRAYLCGSLYSKFYKKGKPNPYGIDLPEGLPVMSRFALPIFTPTDKSETDDECVSDAVVQQYPGAVDVSEKVFRLVRQHLNKRGIELVDSKFEIGKGDIVADEIATPDSSRFALLTDVEPGREPKWLDKQIARDEAERVWGDGEKVPLEFSRTTVRKLTDTYLEVFRLATGMSLREFQKKYLS